MLNLFIKAKEEHNKRTGLYGKKDEDLRKRNGNEKYMC